MGHYTEFVLNVKLKPDLPASAIDVLRFLSGQGPEPQPVPDHPFFSRTQWRDTLIGLPPCVAMPHTPPVFQRDEEDDDDDAPYWLSVRAEFRNSEQEVEQFLDWLLAFLDAMDGDFLGYKKQNYGTDEVTLYYFKETAPFDPGTTRYLAAVKIAEQDGLVRQQAVLTAAPLLLQAPEPRDPAAFPSSTQEARPSSASPRTHRTQQRDDARRRASEGIQPLLDAGMPAAVVAEAYATAALHFLMEHHRYEDARDLLTSFWMQLDRHEENARHDHAST